MERKWPSMKQSRRPKIRSPKKPVPSGSRMRRAVVRNVQLQGRLRAMGHKSLRLAGRSPTVKAPLVILLTL